MPSINEVIRDAVLRRAILEGRVLNAHLADLAAVFDVLRRQVREQALTMPSATVDAATIAQRNAVVAQVRAVYAEAMRQAAPLIAEASKSAAQLGLDFWNRALAESMPVGFSDVIDLRTVNPAMIDAAGSWTAGAGGSNAAQWSAESLLKFSRSARLQAMQAAGFGESVHQLAQRLMGLSDKLGRDQAETMARGVFIHAGEKVADRWAQNNRHVVSRRQWVATLDDRTCQRCGGLDGESWPTDGSEAPGPSPPLHPRCRCSKVPVLKSWRELGIDADEIEPGLRASMDGEVPASMTYDQWLRAQPAGVQREILGPGRWTQWKADGEPGLGSYTDNGRRVLRLDELFESWVSFN